MKKVYVAQYKNIYKIGVSENVEQRIKQLSCGCPGIVAVYESENIANGFEIEKLLHDEFSGHSIGGEWFSYVDLEKVNSLIKENSMKSEIYYKDKRIDFSRFMQKYFPVNKIKEETQELKEENKQLECYLLAVQGLDIPNIYSDLIYDVLFGKDTVQLIETYNSGKYESFRNYLSKKQNEKIEALEKVVYGLIGLRWKFGEISEFVKNMDIMH